MIPASLHQLPEPSMTPGPGKLSKNIFYSPILCMEKTEQIRIDLVIPLKARIRVVGYICFTTHILIEKVVVRVIMLFFVVSVVSNRICFILGANSLPNVSLKFASRKICLCH